MSEWIGLGGSFCISYRETTVSARTLAIQLPDFPDDCGFANPNDARLNVFSELLKMCFTNVIVDKDDDIIRAAAAAGWSLDRLIVRMNSIGVIREQYRWSEDFSARQLYRLYYECGLVYNPDCGWFRVTEVTPPEYKSMGESTSMALAKRYQAIESSLAERVVRLGCGRAGLMEGVQKIESSNALEPCMQFLMDTWLSHIIEIYRDSRADIGENAHPYAFYFDEPHLLEPQDLAKLEFASLLQVIHRNVTAGNTLYAGSKSIFTVIAEYEAYHDYMDEWSPFADYIFPDYYRHGWRVFGGASEHDQRDLWTEDKGQFGGKMNGAFISMLDDHVRQLRKRDFRPTEVPGLIAKAIELGLEHLWVFPGSEAQWRALEKVFQKSRCDLFLDYAREICALQDEAGWIRKAGTTKTKVYCSFFPECSKCTNLPPESSVWTTVRPNNFPDEEELLDPYGIKPRIRFSPEEMMKAGRSDITQTNIG
jgi:hypothetical protein